MSHNSNSLRFVFFGTDEFSVIVLDELKRAHFIPSLIVTAPDTKKGRGMKLTPPPVKVWAENRGIEILQPEKLDGNFSYNLQPTTYNLFVVASYGKIVPKEILDIPQHGTLNVHPSLLPLFRGSSPIHSQILENSKETGVTIMLVDEKVDHGPIVVQKALQFSISHFQFPKLRDTLAHEGGKLLAETIPNWIAGIVHPREQDHATATYTKMVRKEDGRIDLNDDPELNYRKLLAYTPWPSIYFVENGKRIKITDAELQTDASNKSSFLIKKVIPEGKREIRYSEFEKTKKPTERG